MKMAEATYYGTGRRKTSVARVRLVAGQGNIVINGRVLDDYFDLKTLEIIVKQPLELTGTTAVYDVIASVKGGGASGQAGAIRHGISRALLEVDPEYRKILKSAGLLTRDPRMKERKKYGLKKARKASQFTVFSLQGRLQNVYGHPYAFFIALIFYEIGIKVCFK